MIYGNDEDDIDKTAILERLKTEVAHLAKSFAGIAAQDEPMAIVPQSKSPDGYYMPASQGPVEPSA